MSEQWLIIGFLSVLLAAVFGYVLILERRMNKLSRQQEQRIEKIRNELVAMNSAAIGVGQRLISAEKKLSAAIEQQERESERGFEQVAGPGQSSLGSRELVERYGLSEAEADLLALLKSHNVTDPQAA